MKLLTKEILKKLPMLYSTEHIALSDKVAVCKFFSPVGRYTFYVVEGNLEENGEFTFWGYCVSPLGEDCDEFGYVTLSTLESIKLPAGLKIERDRWFAPTKLSDLKIKG